VIVTAALRFAK